MWESASKRERSRKEYDKLTIIIDRIRQAGAEVMNGTDFPSAREIIPEEGWDW